MLTRQADVKNELLAEIQVEAPALFEEFSDDLKCIFRTIYDECLSDSRCNQEMFTMDSECGCYLISVPVIEIYDQIVDHAPYAAKKMQRGFVGLRINSHGHIVSQWVNDPRGYASSYHENGFFEYGEGIVFSSQESVIVMDAIKSFFFSPSMCLGELQFSRLGDGGAVEILWMTDRAQKSDDESSQSDDYSYHHQKAFESLARDVVRYTLSQERLTSDLFGKSEVDMLLHVALGLEGFWLKLLSCLPGEVFCGGSSTLSFFLDGDQKLWVRWTCCGSEKDIDVLDASHFAFDVIGFFVHEEIDLLAKSVCHLLGIGALALPQFTKIQDESPVGIHLTWSSCGDLPEMGAYVVEESSLRGWREGEKIYLLWHGEVESVDLIAEHSRFEAIAFVQQMIAGFYLMLVEYYLDIRADPGKSQLIIEGLRPEDAHWYWEGFPDHKRPLMQSFANEASMLGDISDQDVKILSRILSTQFFGGSLKLPDFTDFQQKSPNMRMYTHAERRSKEKYQFS